MKNCLKILVLLILSSCSFAPGSYPYAERYEVDVEYSVFIERINSFKKANPEYKTPDNLGLLDGKLKHWYKVYFFLAEENEILYTWVQKTTDGKTTFAFVSINEGLELGNWKDINHDYSDLENDKHKEKFEKLILEKLK